LSEKAEKEQSEIEDICRIALNSYLNPPKIDFEFIDSELVFERGVEITSEVAIDVKHYYLEIANQTGINLKEITGEVLRKFVELNGQIATYSPGVSAPELTDKLEIVLMGDERPLLDSLFGESTQTYTDFLNDVFRAGLLAKKNELTTITTNTDNLIIIDLSEIDDPDIIEELKKNSFDELRYYTAKKEEETRKQFAELLNKAKSENQGVSNLEFNEVVSDFKGLLSSTRTVVDTLANCRKPQNLLRTYPKEIILKEFPERLRKLLE
jgi:hypothetical protein